MGKLNWAVITGASGGLGAEFARLAAADGYNVVLAARGRKSLDELATELRKNSFVQVKIYEGDLSKQLVSRGLYDFCVKQNLRVDCLINNAGIGDYSPFIMADWKRLKSMIQLNILTLTELTQVFGKDMSARGYGKILNVASMAAFLSGPNMATYYATKAYVLHLSEAVAFELKTTGVTVTAFCPGPFATGFAKAANAENASIFKKNLPAASKVAKAGYKSMKSGLPVAYVDFKSKVLIGLLGFVPRKLLVAQVAKTQG